MTRLLIIDDDSVLCDLLMEYLQSAGFEADATNEADDGQSRAISGKYAAVILDVMLPGKDGFDVLRGIRAESDVPVLMLTARGDDVDRIVGLEVGADDYLAKPFNPRELTARIRAILRRVHPGRVPTLPTERRGPIRVDDIELDPGARFVRCGNREVSLTATEFALLEILLRSAGTVVGREELSKAVLGRVCTPYDRSLDVHVSNMRRKLGMGPSANERIQSIRGAGYVYVLPRATQP